MKKDAEVVPHKAMETEDRDRYCADMYGMLRGQMFDVLKQRVGSGGLESSGPAQRRTENKLLQISEADWRCEHLAFESELIGNFDRAAKFFKGRLALEKNAKNPEVWFEY